MPLTLAQARDLVARANRMLAHEGVLDAFGHASMRHPTNPNRYLISCSRGTGLVQADDILELDLDSVPVKPTTSRLYSERVIHGEIYKARPDVNAVCHHHAPTILPFCISGVDLKPVYHLGATMGTAVPFWDSRDEFGNTDLIVRKPEEGASLARALGPNWIVLMRRHGATVAGRTLEEMVFRSVYIAVNAGLQIQAHTLGAVHPLNAEEAQLAGDFNLEPGPLARAWEYWSVRLDKAEGNFTPPKRASATARRSAPKQRSTKKPTVKKSMTKAKKRGR